MRLLFLFFVLVNLTLAQWVDISNHGSMVVIPGEGPSDRVTDVLLDPGWNCVELNEISPNKFFIDPMETPDWFSLLDFRMQCHIADNPRYLVVHSSHRAALESTNALLLEDYYSVENKVPCSVYNPSTTTVALSFYADPLTLLKEAGAPADVYDELKERYADNIKRTFEHEALWEGIKERKSEVNYNLSTATNLQSYWQDKMDEAVNIGNKSNKSRGKIHPALDVCINENSCDDFYTHLDNILANNNIEIPFHVANYNEMFAYIERRDYNKELIEVEAELEHLRSTSFRIAESTKEEIFGGIYNRLHEYAGASWEVLSDMLRKELDAMEYKYHLEVFRDYPVEQDYIEEDRLYLPRDLSYAPGCGENPMIKIWKTSDSTWKEKRYGKNDKGECDYVVWEYSYPTAYSVYWSKYKLIGKDLDFIDGLEHLADMEDKFHPDHSVFTTYKKSRSLFDFLFDSTPTVSASRSKAVMSVEEAPDYIKSNELVELLLGEPFSCSAPVNEVFTGLFNASEKRVVVGEGAFVITPIEQMSESAYEAQMSRELLQGMLKDVGKDSIENTITLIKLIQHINIPAKESIEYGEFISFDDILRIYFKDDYEKYRPYFQLEPVSDWVSQTPYLNPTTPQEIKGKLVGDILEIAFIFKGLVNLAEGVYELSKNGLRLYNSLKGSVRNIDVNKLSFSLRTQLAGRRLLKRSTKPFQEDPLYCGEACMQIILGQQGIKVSQKALSKYSTPEFGGSSSESIQKTLNEFNVGLKNRFVDGDTFKAIYGATAEEIRKLDDYSMAMMKMGNYHHWVMVKIKGGVVEVLDPMEEKIGGLPKLEYKTLEWLEEKFTSVMIVNFDQFSKLIN